MNIHQTLPTSLHYRKKGMNFSSSSLMKIPETEVLAADKEMARVGTHATIASSNLLFQKSPQETFFSESFTATRDQNITLKNHTFGTREAEIKRIHHKELPKRGPVLTVDELNERADAFIA
eukprot:c18063_g1_i1 orf=294-656(+)